MYPNQTTKQPNNMSDTNTDTDNCVICLSLLNDNKSNIRALKCMHKFHHECILVWLRRSNLCPLCKCPQNNSTNIKHKQDFPLNEILLQWTLQRSRQDMARTRRIQYQDNDVIEVIDLTKF